MSDTVLRVEKLENGFEVEIFDEKIESKNMKSKNTSYESPWKAYAFTTAAEVVKFVEKHLDGLPKSSQDEFNDAAAEAFSKE